MSSLHVISRFALVGTLLLPGCVVRGVLDAGRDSADLPDDTAGTSGEDTADTSGVDTTDTSGVDTAHTSGVDTADTSEQDTAGGDPMRSLWISLSWAHEGDDLDLHLLAPDGQIETDLDCYYANCVDWGAAGQELVDWGVQGDPIDDPRLDLDAIPGTGPENIVLEAPAPGTYTVVVNDYPGSVFSGPNDFVVMVYVGGSSTTLTGTAIAEDSYLHVATITFPGGEVTPLAP